jgi:hypothetical protein
LKLLNWVIFSLKNLNRIIFLWSSFKRKLFVFPHVKNVLKSWRDLFIQLAFECSFLFLLQKFLNFVEFPRIVFKSKTKTCLLDFTEHYETDICQQVYAEKSDHRKTHDFSSRFVLNEVCKTQDVVVHYRNKNLIVLIPKVKFSLIWLMPSNIDEHKYYKKVGNKDLEIFEILQEY